jgi:hypothetical protein
MRAGIGFLMTLFECVLQLVNSEGQRLDPMVELLGGCEYITRALYSRQLPIRTDPYRAYLIYDVHRRRTHQSTLDERNCHRATRGRNEPSICNK